jgi:MFS family permease
VPAILYYLTHFYSQSRLTVPYTLVVLGQTLAQVLGGPLAAAIMLLEGAAGLPGWRWLFLLEGIPAVLLAAAMWWDASRARGGC